MTETGAETGAELISIGAAAARTGTSDRALRYYQELGLIRPAGSTPGGMRRYSPNDLARVARIRELQNVLGLNLEEIAAVLASEDRLAEIREVYNDERTDDEARTALLRECLELQQRIRATVEAKRSAIDRFLVGLDERMVRISRLLEGGAS